MHRDHRTDPHKCGDNLNTRFNGNGVPRTLASMTAPCSVNTLGGYRFYANLRLQNMTANLYLLLGQSIREILGESIMIASHHSSIMLREAPSRWANYGSPSVCVGRNRVDVAGRK